MTSLAQIMTLCGTDAATRAAFKLGKKILLTRLLLLCWLKLLGTLTGWKTLILFQCTCNEVLILEQMAKPDLLPSLCVRVLFDCSKEKMYLPQ